MLEKIKLDKEKADAVTPVQKIFSVFPILLQHCRPAPRLSAGMRQDEEAFRAAAADGKAGRI